MTGHLFVISCVFSSLETDCVSIFYLSSYMSHHFICTACQTGIFFLAFFFSFNGEIETEMKENVSTHLVCVHSRLTEA